MNKSVARSQRPLSQVQLAELLDFTRTATPESMLLLRLRRKARPHVRFLESGFSPDTQQPRPGAVWFANPQAACGDAPDKVHPKFLLAVLSSRALMATNLKETGEWLPPSEWSVPKIDFETDVFVRRSMTLNGMRMTTEFFGTGSLRVLQLVEQRLHLGQRDVIHDILVYLANQILDVRAEEQEARMLRAEAVAAYLGLHRPDVENLFKQSPVNAGRIAHAIETGSAGPIRRSLDVSALVSSQVAILHPSLESAKRAERRALQLVDRIVALL